MHAQCEAVTAVHSYGREREKKEKTVIVLTALWRGHKSKEKWRHDLRRRLGGLMESVQNSDSGIDY